MYSHNNYKFISYGQFIQQPHRNIQTKYKKKNKKMEN